MEYTHWQVEVVVILSKARVLRGQDGVQLIAHPFVLTTRTFKCRRKMNSVAEGSWHGKNWFAEATRHCIFAHLKHMHYCHWCACCIWNVHAVACCATFMQNSVQHCVGTQSDCCFWNLLQWWKSSLIPTRSQDILNIIRDVYEPEEQQGKFQILASSHHLEGEYISWQSKEKSDFFFDQYLIFLQVSSFGAGRVWTADCSFKAFFNQEFHVLLQALRGKDRQTNTALTYFNIQSDI